MAPKKKTTVLVHEWVTGGGLAGSPLPDSWAAEGRAMRRAIAADFASVPDVQVVMTLDAGLLDDPGPWATVRLGPGEEIERLVELAKPLDFMVLIAPECNGILAERAKLLANLGVHSLGSSPQAIALTGNKLHMSEHFLRHDFRTPQTLRVVPSDGLPANFPYPAVLKPIDGAGSVDTFFLTGPTPLPAEALALPEALLQPFVAGALMSASFLVGEGKARLIGIGRQNVTARDGRFLYEGGTLPIPSTMIDESVQRVVESIPGLAGFVGVDYIWDDDVKHAIILEVNPRPTTSYVGLARILLPGTLAQAWIDVVTGRQPSETIDLAALVQAHNPVTFCADGAVQAHGEESEP